MKIRIFAAAAAMALLLCACHSEPQPIPTEFPEPVPETIELPPTAEALPPDEPYELPPVSLTEVTEETPIEPVEVSIVTTDGCFDEVCSYCLERPVFNEGNAYPNINLFYEKLEQSIISRIGGNIYDTAMERGCVANVSGSCHCQDDGEILTVTYMLTLDYSDADAAETFTQINRFDLHNDALLEELP